MEYILGHNEKTGFMLPVECAKNIVMVLSMEINTEPTSKKMFDSFTDEEKLLFVNSFINGETNDGKDNR